MKNKICLAIILGNESDVIDRCLSSFLPAVDYVSAVIATGNQPPDPTAAKVQEACCEAKIPFRISTYRNHGSRDWAHLDSFAAARNLAWDQSFYFDCQWLLWCDADDVLSDGGADVIRECAKVEDEALDAWVFPYDTGREITMRDRLIRHGRSYWEHAIHEQPAYFKSGRMKICEEARWIHKPLDTKTSSHERNLAILQAEISDASRNAFYLHQQHFLHGDKGEATVWGKVALACPDSDKVERYETLLNLAQMETTPQEARRLASEAFAIMPNRREALAYLSAMNIAIGNFKDAAALARQMMTIPKPKDVIWSLNHAWYDWKGAQLYAQTLRLTGKASDADDLLQSVYERNNGKISVIHATLGRPQQALAIRELWLSRAKNPNGIQYIFGLHSFDEKSGALKGFPHAITDRPGAGPNLASAASIATGEVFVQAQDDIFPPEGWDEIILNRLGDLTVPKFLAVSDGHRNDRLCVTSIMTRPYVEQKAISCDGGGFGHDGYHSMYWDTENTYRAYKDGVVTEAKDVVFFHNHPAFVPGLPWDQTYQIENAPEHYKTGAELFNQRNPEAATDGIL